jgi:DNA-binding response OmpR family regulator
MASEDSAVAVINSNEDTVEMLRACLQQNGFTSVTTAHVTDIRNGRTDFLKFLEEHDPKIIVYDVGIPYEENWRFLQLLMSSDAMKGRRIVVTTTNKRVLDRLVGSETRSFEIVGKPYDLQVIVDAVQKAAAKKSTSSEAVIEPLNRGTTDRAGG